MEFAIKFWQKQGCVLNEKKRKNQLLTNVGQKKNSHVSIYVK